MQVQVQVQVHMHLCAHVTQIIKKAVTTVTTVTWPQRGSKSEPAARQAKGDGSECEAVTSAKVKSSPMHETCTKVLKNYRTPLTGAH